MTARIDGKIPDLISLREAATILGMSKQAAHKYVIKGVLAGKQIDGAWVFRRAVVERLGATLKTVEDPGSFVERKRPKR